MDNVKTSWWESHRPSKRRLVQLYCALLYNAHLKGFVEGEIYKSKSPTTKGLCVPGFNCYSCPGAVGACPLGALQNAIGTTNKQVGFYVFGILMLYGLILGRTICGWLCPLGLIQELLHKIPTPKLKKSRVTRALSWLKYILLAVFVVGITAWYGVAHGVALPGFCKYICPAGTFEGAVFLLANPNNAGDFSMLGILFTRKFVIMLVIGLACVFCYRSFCRFLCPLGAIYGLFCKLAVVGVKVDATRCNGCGACVRSCGMDVRHVGDHECIHCARCMDVCSQKAISLKAGKYTLKAPVGGCADDKPDSEAKRKRFGKIAWAIALAVLCAALLWYNFLDPNIKKDDVPAQTAEATETAAPALEIEDWSSDAPLGCEVGNQLPDFSIACLDGSTFCLSEMRGKPVFINLWATYCGPCVKELPHFAELYKAHEDDIAMLALHSDIVVDEPAEYLAEFGRDWTMPFAVENDDEAIWELVGGTTAMPQTIVLNRRGEVIYNQRGSVTPEMLEALYQQAAGESPAEESAEPPAPAVTEAPTETEPPAPTETELPAEPEAPAIAETEIPAETTRITETAAEPDEEPAAAETGEAEPETGASPEASNYDGITRLLEQYLRDRAETGASQETK
ncbi:MAG: redoxin family protein [Oscillospiraceae bacterium]|nr:redoxin family protein [Oscillospiraceae bacterium]